MAQQVLAGVTIDMSDDGFMTDLKEMIDRYKNE